jgi:hypothetical protein
LLLNNAKNKKNYAKKGGYAITIQYIKIHLEFLNKQTK